jgi:hypothetical protein
MDILGLDAGYLSRILQGLTHGLLDANDLPRMADVRNYLLQQKGARLLAVGLVGSVAI